MSAQLPPVVSEIAQKMEEIDNWVLLYSPDIETIIVKNACQTCERNLSLRKDRLPFAPQPPTKANYLEVSASERRLLSNNAQKYFQFAKAVLRSLASTQKDEFLKILHIPSCKHLRHQVPSYEISRDLRRSLRPLLNVLVKELAEEEKRIKAVLKSPNLKHVMQGSNDYGYQLVCDSCIQEKDSDQPINLFTEYRKEKGEELLNLPCVDELYHHFDSGHCNTQQMRIWLSENGFQLLGFRMPSSMFFEKPIFAEKNGKQFLLTFSSFFRSEWLSRLPTKFDYVIGKGVHSNIFELPLQEEAIIYDYENKEAISLSDIKIGHQLELLVDSVIGQKILTLDHEAIKNLFTQLGKKKGYITFGEVVVGIRDRTDVVWFDKTKKCILAMEIEFGGIGSSILAKDFHKFKKLNPELAVLILKKGEDLQILKDFAKDMTCPVLALFLSTLRWTLLEEDKLKTGELKTSQS